MAKEIVRRLRQDMNWAELETIDNDRRVTTLSLIAAVNLKKSPGGHTTDPVELIKIADEDRDYLNRQFTLYQPDLIICCGTSDTFHDLVSTYGKPNWKQTQRGVWFHEYSPGKYVIAY
ncbi:hypothetical protein [Solemya velum gill symbiont]|uniref:hypothetical protein n=1 Tax=Solemya velum gill symbiont TaxID=2340 RepID=UPI00117B56D1|nr:hypothetical protein [Solemya velum gill symbiont]